MRRIARPELTVASWRRAPVVDVAVAAVATAIAIAVVVYDGDRDVVELLSLAAAVIGGAAIVVRRLVPTLVLAVVMSMRVVLTLTGIDRFALVPALAVALFTVARSGSRRHAVTIAIVGALFSALFTAGFDQDEPFAPELLNETAAMLLPVAAGVLLRERAARLGSMVDHEAELRLQAERLRIARDLHDVVAHGLSTITVQSGVAAHLLEKNPEQAKVALEVINDTGKRSLEELRAMVGVLRSTDGAPLEPVTIASHDLTSHVEDARRAGVEVRLDVSGRFPDDVSDATTVAFHRILQEALTNVARHAGPVRARIEVRHEDDRVRLRVENDPMDPLHPPPPVASTGVGIIGMGERAASLGGTVDAGPSDDGGWVVEATLPYYRHRE